MGGGVCCRLTSRIRAQSPSSVHHYSPTRHPSKPSTNDKKAEEKNAEKALKHESKSSSQPSTQGGNSVLDTEAAKSKSCKGQTFEKHLRGNSSENGKSPSPDRKGHMSPKVDHSDKKVQCSAQNGEKKKGGIGNWRELFFKLKLSSNAFKYGITTLLFAFDRIRICRVDGEGGSWHNKRRGGHQATDRAKASGSRSERTGGETSGRRKALYFFAFFQINK